jgi:hypothetical protein
LKDRIMSRAKIPKWVIRVLGEKLSRKALLDATRLLFSKLRSDNRVWRKVFDHIAEHFSDDAAKASHGVFNKTYHSYDSLKKLLMEACQKPSHAPYFSKLNGEPRVVIEKEFTKVIGKATDGSDTKVLRIITDVTGNPVTAYPISKSAIGTAGVVFAVQIAGAEASYAAEAVRESYAEEFDAHQRQYENVVFDRTGGYGGAAVDLVLDLATFGILGGATTAGELNPQDVAAPGDVAARAKEAIVRIESRLGMKLDPQTQDGIRRDIIAIWGYAQPGDALPVEPPKATKGRLHEVRAGESLSQLAKKYYRDAGQWKRVYAANYSTIGTNPNLLRVGTKLVIPE